MKKKIMAILSFVLILLISFSVLFNSSKKSDLKKVRVADTAITSWT